MNSIRAVERHLLLEGIYLEYGYDFRGYAEASLNRRIEYLLTKFGIHEPLDLLKKIVQEKDFFYKVLPCLTVNTTEFLRDPLFFATLREKVFPFLKTYPSLNIWVAGCSTGEELYSIAVLLKEEGLLERSTLYATDINSEVLKKAKEGIFELSAIQTFTKNYLAAGGTKSPSDYYTADYGLGIFQPLLRENVVFSEHNLVTDGVFAEMHLILCRNVLIYFNRELQNRVLDLCIKALVPRGFLGMGSKESMRFSSCMPFFDPLGGDNLNNIYQKKFTSEYEVKKAKYGQD